MNDPDEQRAQGAAHPGAPPGGAAPGEAPGANASHPRRRRRRGRRARRVPPGSAPGQLVVDPDAPRSRVHVVVFGAEGVEERSDVDPASLAALRSRCRPGQVLWVDVRGLGDARALETVGAAFGLHPLALEDVVHTEQRPKTETYADHLFIVLRAVSPEGGLEQDCVFLGNGWVVTFQERLEDTFDRVRQRVKDGRQRIRAGGADYLAYALIDRVVDGFFPTLEGYAEVLEQLEEEVVGGRPAADIVTRIHGVRSELLSLRRAVWPLRDMLRALVIEGSDVLGQDTRLYLRDCADHALQLNDGVEMYRDMGKSLLDLHLSMVGQRTNEITKVLTIIATIFIPLSFIASVYGMNFNPLASPFNMPELDAYWGYPAALGLMAAVALVLLGWFQHRGWLGTTARPRAAGDEGRGRQRRVDGSGPAAGGGSPGADRPRDRVRPG